MGRKRKWLGIDAMLVAVAVASLLGAPSLSRAEGETLYHVRSPTLGCASPEYTHALLGRQVPHPNDPNWFNQNFAIGRCATISSRSNWRLLSKLGDLDFMAYVGTVGAPGSFYFLDSAMFDEVGEHPGAAASMVAPPKVAPPAVSSPQAAPPPAAPYPNYAKTNETALVPPADSRIAPFGEKAVADSPPLSTETIVILIMASLGLVWWAVASRAARILAARRKSALDAAIEEVRFQARKLHVRYEQLTQPDYYGSYDFTKWWKEKEDFFSKRIWSVLSRESLLDQIDWVKPAVMAEIDRCATQEIQPLEALAPPSSPEIFSLDMDPIHYEMHCALQLQKAGWITRATPVTGDQGADILAERAGRTLVVQCKLYSSPVGNGAVQEAFAAKGFQRAHVAAVVSNAPFTRSARQLAGMNDVHLLHHDELVAFEG